MQQGKLNQERKLSKTDHFNELIMLGLRTKGVNIEEALLLIRPISRIK